MGILDKILIFVKSAKFFGPIIIIISSVIFFKIIVKIIDKASINGKDELEKKRRVTIIILLKNIIKYAIVMFAVLGILTIYGINTHSLVTGIGIAGVVIGLALQDALKDIIGGINIILDNYYVVGDLVTFNDFTGKVQALGLKTTKIVNFNGEVLIIANRNIDKIINLSQKKKILMLDIPTAYEEDHVKVEKVLNEVLEKIKKDKDVIADETVYLGINDFGTSSISYLIKIKCIQGSQYRVKREVYKLIKEAYEKNNIKIPFDQIEVHHGQDI